jgi:hypothetical protein
MTTVKKYEEIVADGKAAIDTAVQEAYARGRESGVNQYAHVHAAMAQLANLSGRPSGFSFLSRSGVADIVARIKARFEQYPPIHVTANAEEIATLKDRNARQAMCISAVTDAIGLPIGQLDLNTLGKEVKDRLAEKDKEIARLTEKNQNQQRFLREIAKAVGMDPLLSVELNNLVHRVSAVAESERDLIERNEKLTLKVGKLRREQVDEFHRGLQQGVQRGREEERAEILAAAARERLKILHATIQDSDRERSITFELCGQH